MSAAQLPPRNPSPGQPLWTAPPKQSGGSRVPAVVGIILASFVGILLGAYLAAGLGVSTLIIGFLLALVPLTVVLLTVRWVDRWEPEPRWALWFALLWGGAVSVAIALLVDLGVQVAVAFADPGGSPDEAVQAIVQAPLVEETAKGLGVLLIYVFSRSQFNGPVDGIVYASVVAGGFAFTENILYFGTALAEGGAEELGATFVLRGIFSPFAHVLFTTCTGLAIGIAARRGGGPSVIGWFLLGLSGAVFLHALWNASLTFASDAIGVYFTVQVPIFIGAVLLVMYLRRQEVRITRDRLAEYGAAGWFSPTEVEILSSPAGRRRALAWARAQNPPRTTAMRKMIADSTDLAFTRQREITGRGDQRIVADEQGLLQAVAADRVALQY